MHVVFCFIASQASILQRQKSVESIGIVQDVRGGAWLQQGPDGPTKTHLSLNWATLLQGAEREYKADPHRKNGIVQQSVSQGLRRAKASSVSL